MSIILETLRNYATRTNDQQSTDGTNSTVYNQRKCWGWSFVTGDGINSTETKTITLPITYDTHPFIQVSLAGYKDGSNPSNLSDLSVTANFDVGSAVTNKSSFDILVKKNDGTAITSGRRLAFTWKAEGTYDNYD